MACFNRLEQADHRHLEWQRVQLGPGQRQMGRRVVARDTTNQPAVLLGAQGLV